MYCHNCGKEINDTACFCDRCGAKTSNPYRIPINSSSTNVPQKPIYKRWWFWVVIALLLIPSISSREDDPSESSNSQSASSQSTESHSSKNEITVSEQRIYEENGITITATGIKSTYTGIDITLLVENNTATNIAVGCFDFIVNGITVDGHLYIQVAAGKKANGDLSLDTDSLKSAGIEVISTLETFDAYISNTDTYRKTNAISFSVNTSATDFVQTLDESGDVLFSQGGITVIAKRLNNDFTGGTITILVKNDSGQDVVVQADNVSVNGYTISVLHSDGIPNGSVRFCEITLLEKHLKDNNIENIETVTFTLDILHPKTFQTLLETNELELHKSS